MKRFLLIAIVFIAVSLNAQITGLENLTYHLELTSFTPMYVAGVLTMTNPHDQDWEMYFPYSTIAEIWVDDVGTAGAYLPVVIPVTVPANQSCDIGVGYYAMSPLSAGVHIARAHAVDNEFTGIGNYVQFTIQPSASSDNVQALSQSRIYPNPFSASFTISLTSPKVVSAQVGIYNLKGQKVKEMANVPLVAGENAISWQAVDDSGKRLPNGTYLIKIRADGDSRTIRAMVVN